MQHYYTKRIYVRTLPGIFPLASVLMLVLILTACSDKPKDKFPSEPYTEIENNFSTSSQNTTQEQHQDSLLEENRQSNGISFTLSDQNGITHTIIPEEDNRVQFKDIPQSIVLVNFFSTWSIPCQGEAPYLSDLQKKYDKELFVMGVLLHPDNHLQELETFMQKNQVSYFISSSSENDAFAKVLLKPLQLPDMLPIPLTVIYKDGDYYRHYEGAVPVEMIEHDIKVLLEKH
jgi:thiol-disulfide isomerase/thioredoxin